ncbi:N-chimaerin-like protein [Sarcoptes scabiei]|uniref:N-chimaerin-like protein n=1 Tax=Sarcoptes scabiei TaxID=52283 RepID=A0A132A2N9_SARSC|nr:N-chimaerin-like protein [Sarcoptes scabiei]
MSSVPNYRQEIRGILQQPSDKISDASTSIVLTKSLSEKEQKSKSNNQKQSQRLSRVVYPQLHQHLKNLWKHYLYELQQRAPIPKRVICPFVIRSRPSFYGREFHGIMSRDEAEQILLEEDGVDGRYLIRQSARQKSQMTLSLRFNRQTKNFRLFYENGQHYVNDMKRFDTVHDLVADGLITLYVELHASDYIANLGTECRYEESPYMTLHKDRLRPLIAENRSRQDCGKSKQSNLGIIPIPLDDRIGEKSDDFDNEANKNQSLSLVNEEKFDVKLLKKAHNFKTHTFIGHPWCDFCGNFIWGLIGQGVRCEDCGFGAHRKCSELVPNDCCPDLRHIRRIFGIDLTTFCKASDSIRPFIVEQCIAEVERRGLRTEGIYRACGSSDEIEALKNRFESSWDQTELDQIDDIHVITGLLKLYLRLLPIPVCAYEDENLMSAKNLSLIFGQTLIYTPNIPVMFQMNCWEFESKTIEMMILFHNKIFVK